MKPLSIMLRPVVLLLSVTTSVASASEYRYPLSSDECDAMSVWDVETAMCMPYPRAGMGMTMAMLHGNAFFAGVAQSGPRGRDAIVAPDMVMGDLGTTVADRHYLNVDLMLTAEKWTYPDRGYPLLTQIGEDDAAGRPFVDAQHPHSSPIMGVTVSDTIRLDTGGARDHLKLYFAPRGESTDGPIAFMHRPSGMANPDAPLGHHLGQDAGHISSTVIGASLKLGDERVEASAFHGTEPEPTKVDLPIGSPNSYALRLVHEFSPATFAMVSGAYVRNPEAHDADIASVTRYSASLYSRHSPFADWTLYNTVIFGLITKYDHVPTLASFGEEFWLYNEGSDRWFARAEVLERTPDELAIENAARPASPRWLLATTVGYARALAQFDGGELSAGASVSYATLPSTVRDAYGTDPFSGKVFLQVNAMKMWMQHTHSHSH